jgi:hypothetical protein
VIVYKAIAFVAALSELQLPADSPVTPKAVMMVEPEGFYVGEETVPGRLVIGNMRYPIRQLESERADIPGYFTERGYDIVDLRNRDCVAELTGVLILDLTPDEYHTNVVFSALTARACVVFPGACYPFSWDLK